MKDRYAESHEIFAKAKEIIPGGVTKARVGYIPGRYLTQEDCYS